MHMCVKVRAQCVGVGSLVHQSVTGIKALLFTESWRQAKMYTSFLKCQAKVANFNFRVKSNSVLTCFIILLLKCSLLHGGGTRQYLLKS